MASDNEASIKTMTRQELWTLSYKAKPYLSHLSVDDLARRLQDVMANLTTLTPEGKIGMDSTEEPGRHPWLKLSAHILEEYRSREIGLQANFLDRAVFPQPSTPTPAKGFLESKRLGKDFSQSLVKYGNRSWLAKAMSTGKWRISPASYYSDHSLCKARLDSELEIPTNTAQFERTEKRVLGLEGEYYHTLIGAKVINIKAATDYYLVCLARGIIYRMFDDFQSDACLIIHDEAEFERRMLKAFPAVTPSWHCIRKTVEYVDPCSSDKPVDVYFAKHFRYAYQEEVRFVWLPSLLPIMKLPQFTINLGPLNDICELLLLNKDKFQTASD